jgi:hypothetical protein
MTDLTPKQVKQLVIDALSVALNSGGNLKVIPYEGDISYKALEFLEDFEDCAKSKGWTDDNKFDRFGCYLKCSAKEWFKLNVTKNPSPPSDWNSLKKAFIDHHLPKDRNRYYREQLSKRKQTSKESVSHYIVSKHLLCLEVNPSMSEKEIMLHIFEDMLPNIKRELYIREFTNLQELKDNAVKVENGLKIMFNEGLTFENNNETNRSLKTLIEEYKLISSKVEDTSNQINNLTQNKNYRNDRFRNNYQPRYANNVSRNFRNNSYSRFNNKENFIRKFNTYENYNQNQYHNLNYESIFNPNKFSNEYGQYDEYEDYLKPSSNQRYINSAVAENLIYKHNKRDAPYDNFHHEIIPNNPQKINRRQRSIPVNMLGKSHDRINNLIYLNVKINDVAIESMIDSGAVVSVIDYDLAVRLGLDIVPYNGYQMRAFNGSNIEVIGSSFIKISVPNRLIECEICPLVIKNSDFDLILGNDFNKKANIIIDCSKKTVIFKEEFQPLLDKQILNSSENSLDSEKVNEPELKALNIKDIESNSILSDKRHIYSVYKVRVENVNKTDLNENNKELICNSEIHTNKSICEKGSVENNNEPNISEIDFSESLTEKDNEIVVLENINDFVNESIDENDMNESFDENCFYDCVDEIDINEFIFEKESNDDSDGEGFEFEKDLIEFDYEKDSNQSIDVKFKESSAESFNKNEKALVNKKTRIRNPCYFYNTLILFSMFLKLLCVHIKNQIQFYAIDHICLVSKIIQFITRENQFRI